MMFAIKARYEHYNQVGIGGEWEVTETEDIVALFSTRERAEEYIEKSRLKQVRRRTFAPNVIFRSNSLLSTASEAWVEEYVSECYDVDPEI